MTRKQKKVYIENREHKNSSKRKCPFLLYEVGKHHLGIFKILLSQKNRTFKIIFPFLKELKVKVLVFNLHYPFIVTCLWPTSGST